VYGGDESTPNENIGKHQGFKGYCTSFKGGSQYVRMHMMTTPLGQTGIFHSVEIYLRDPSGNVSFTQGWVDYAQGGSLSTDGATRNFFQSSSCGSQFNDGNQPDGRPRLIVHCGEQANPFESWYNDFHSIGGELGFTVQDTYSAIGVPLDPSTWTAYNNLGLGRRIEITWTSKNKPDGWFVADQFGRLMLGMSDARCGATVTAHGQSHKVLCLWQYVAPTAIEIGNPNNAAQFDYPGAGVTLPN
jgi:hypothetical protein